VPDQVEDRVAPATYVQGLAPGGKHAPQLHQLLAGPIWIDQHATAHLIPLHVQACVAHTCFYPPARPTNLPSAHVAAYVAEHNLKHCEFPNGRLIHRDTEVPSIAGS
jgi:hypothetical protein